MVSKVSNMSDMSNISNMSNMSNMSLVSQVSSYKGCSVSRGDSMDSGHMAVYGICNRGSIMISSSWDSSNGSRGIIQSWSSMSNCNMSHLVSSKGSWGSIVISSGRNRCNSSWSSGISQSWCSMTMSNTKSSMTMINRSITMSNCY